MNITLSAPPENVQIVRQWAAQEHTSLNQYIRDVLDQKAKEILEARRKAADEFVARLKTLPKIKMPPGWKFSREEANYRPMKCMGDS